ncbi:hypothetical protein EUX98_g6304 [Antrodiella citrinella]|uniref:Uncharacterized protein n=1 Tax=Antrodiella citrinella TaxID=2447956 RepID=A0A4S4MPA4_9APHY|nr:hypothetical protein EUX98_g6304 [Antrodiella citrinella]
MPRTSRHKLKAAARARSGLAASRQLAAAANEPPNVIIVDSDSDKHEAQGGSDSETEDGCTVWTGGVSHNPCLSDSSDSEWEDNDSDSETGSSDSESCMEVHTLDDEELLVGLQDELQKLSKPTPYEELLNIDQRKWKTAESQRNLGYHGHSVMSDDSRWYP